MSALKVNLLIALLFMGKLCCAKNTDAYTQSETCMYVNSLGGTCPLYSLHNLRENPPAPIKIEGTDIVISSESIKYQTEAVLLSFLGDESGAQLITDVYEASNDSESESERSNFIAENYTAYPAIPKILELAKDFKIVMLNEAHHVSRHRIFATELAKGLKRIGYTHIAAETFSNIKALNENGYPTIHSGPYVKDPEFAHFLREAASIGFQFIKYESSDVDREQGQAKNLAQFIDSHIDAKVLVYAGYSHIKETSSSEKGEQWMAQKFKEMTGIDPLTIDQVGGTPKFTDKLKDPIFSTIKINDGPIVWMNKQDNWLVASRYKNYVDLTVFHPYESKVNGRPDWLANDANRRELTLYTKQLGNEWPLVLKAYLKNEWDNEKNNAIPVDQVIIQENERVKTSLFLPSGDYVIRTETLGEPDKFIKIVEVL